VWRRRSYGCRRARPRAPTSASQFLYARVVAPSPGTMDKDPCVRTGSRKLPVRSSFTRGGQAFSSNCDVDAAASRGNVVLFCGGGNHVDLRGLELMAIGRCRSSDPNRWRSRAHSRQTVPSPSPFTPRPIHAANLASI